MNKRIGAAVLAGLLLISMTGCQLAREDAGSGSDRLIGMYVTEEYLDLFDLEGYLNAHPNMLAPGKTTSIDPDSAPAYEGRIYAEKTVGEDGEPRYTFPGVEGKALLHLEYTDENGEACHGTQVDEGIITEDLVYHETDEGKGVELTGTIYAVGVGPHRCFGNPVYQTADGQVYVVAAAGISSDTVGGEMSQSADWEETVTENGVSRREFLNVTIKVKTVLEAEKVVVAEYDEALQQIASAKYGPADMPESIRPGGDTAFILVELTARNEENEVLTERQIYDREDGEIRPDGDVCLNQLVNIIW